MNVLVRNICLIVRFIDSASLYTWSRCVFYHTAGTCCLTKNGPDAGTQSILGSITFHHHCVYRLCRTNKGKRAKIPWRDSSRHTSKCSPSSKANVWHSKFLYLFCNSCHLGVVNILGHIPKLMRIFIPRNTRLNLSMLHNHLFRIAPKCSISQILTAYLLRSWKVNSTNPHHYTKRCWNGI